MGPDGRGEFEGLRVTAVNRRGVGNRRRDRRRTRRRRRPGGGPRTEHPRRAVEGPPGGCDVGDDASCRAAVQTVVDELGGLDILVNNAGVGSQGTVADNSDDEWHKVFDINVLGMVRITRAALPHLRASRSAAVVNTCSIAATAGLPQRALYSATKGAVLSLTRAMAADHLREGIRVNCVNPGTADTPWISRLLSVASDPAAERAALEARQPHGRLVSAAEVAGAVAYLASPVWIHHRPRPRGGRREQALRLRPVGDP